VPYFSPSSRSSSSSGGRGEGDLSLQGSLFGACSLRDITPLFFFPTMKQCKDRISLCEERGTRKPTNETLSRRGGVHAFSSSWRPFSERSPFYESSSPSSCITSISDDAWAAPSGSNMCVCVYACMCMRARRHSQ